MASKKFKKRLDDLLRKKVRVSARDDKAVSNKTRATRRIEIIKCFKDLDSLKIKLETPYQFKENHLKALFKLWEERGYSPKTIDCKVSVLRIFSSWIDKPGMLGKSSKYSSDPHFKVEHCATRDHSWSGNGVEILQKFREVYFTDVYVGIQLELQLAYALRAAEAWKMKPYVCDQRDNLNVTWGTKGGRPRQVPIKTTYQREVLEYAKTLTSENGSMIPTKYTERAWRARFYKVCRANGISRASKITPHGLRHEYANNLFETLSGVLSPIRRTAADATPKKETDAFARTVVAEHLGHSRPAITNAYIGTSNPPKPLKDEG